MADLRALQASFAGGELSPALWARTDLAKYQTGLRLAKNVFVHPHGGVSNLPGTWYVGETKYPTRTVRLIPFVYSVEQAYVLEFGHKYLRVIMNGDYVLDGAVPYEVVTPYTEDMLPDIGYTQSADVLYLVHPTVRPKQLERYGHDSWTLADYDYKLGPFLDENTTSTTITPTGTLTAGGTVTLTASTSIWQSTDVGELVRVSQRVPENSLKHTFSASGTSPSIDVEGEWNLRTSGDWDGTLKLERSYDGGTTWLQFRTLVGNSIEEGQMDYTFTEDLTDDQEAVKIRVSYTKRADSDCIVTINAAARINNGIVRITGYTSGTVVTGTVVNKLYSTAATKLWARGAWSPRNGYPYSVQFYQDRLAFGGSPSFPNKLWFSETGNYISFKVSAPQTDDNAITAQMASRSVNRIRNLVSLRDLLVLTAGSEWRVFPGSQGAFTYKQKQIEAQGFIGSSQLEAITASNSVLFVQDKGNGIYSLAYTYEEDGYSNRDLSLFAEHLFEEKKVVSWAYQQQPWSLIWAVMDDGSINVLTYIKEHEVWAWSHRHTTGAYEAVASIPGDSRDEVYFAVRREIGGSERVYLERLADRVPIKGGSGDVTKAMFLDCGGRYSGGPVTSISGLDWLEGCTVTALADGGVVTDLTVTDGAITLPHSASIVTVGLPYTAEIETLQLDAQLRDGTVQGRRIRIPGVILRVRDTRGLTVSPGSHRSPDRDVEMKPLFITYDPQPLFTGDSEPIALDSGWDRNGGRLYIRQDHPLPFTILGILPSADIGG